MTRRHSTQLMHRPHVHSLKEEPFAWSVDLERARSCKPPQRKVLLRRAKSTVGRWRDPRVLIALLHVLDHSKSAHRKTGLRTSGASLAACRRLHLEDDWARVNQRQVHSARSHKGSARMDDQELTSDKLNRGASFLQRRSLRNVFGEAKRARIGRGQRDLEPSDNGNDVQARTPRPKYRDRLLANPGPRCRAISGCGIDESRQCRVSPEVPLNRSTARRTKTCDNAQTDRTSGRRADSCELSNLCVARALERGAGLVGGLLILGRPAI